MDAGSDIPDSALAAEADPAVAKRHAAANFERLTAELPHHVQQREAQLLAELKSVPGSPLKKLRHLYRASEALMRDLAPYIACSAGCASCCHYPVSVYPLEAELIEKRTGHRRQRAPAETAVPGSACVFLRAGRCSIYADRPMVCRMHVALTSTAYWCAPERCNDIELPMAGFSEINAALTYIIQLDGRGQPLDIRQAFGASTPDDKRIAHTLSD
jgi:hypothetical protein